jgi:phosphotransferase system  glucose/maltose/N-acetylglucosamine-specific IIC component
MGRLISLLILVIDVIVIIDILKSNKDNERKILWIIAVVFLPILGPILYYFIGKK